MRNNVILETDAVRMLCNTFNSIIDAASKKQTIDEYIADVYYIYTITVSHKYEKLKSYIEQFLREIGSNKYYELPAAVKFLTILEKEYEALNNEKESIEKVLTEIRDILSNAILYNNRPIHENLSYKIFHNTIDKIYDILKYHEDTYEYIVINAKISAINVLYSEAKNFDTRTLLNLLCNIRSTIDILLIEQ